MNDPNEKIRHIIIEDVILNRKLFSTTNLQEKFVPFLIKEFEQGWKENDSWLFQNCRVAIKFLIDRDLLLESYLAPINSYFQVTQSLTKSRQLLTLEIAKRKKSHYQILEQ